jgi:O-antigen/teichoic acid export membrane protein
VWQTALGTILSFVQIKVLSNFLSADDFGLFASLRGLSLLLSLLAAHGLPQLLVRFLPVHEATRDRTGAMRLVGVSFASAGALLLLLLLTAFVLRGGLLAFVDSSRITGELALWFAIATAGVLFRQVLYAGLQGLRRMIPLVSIDLAALTAALACMVYFRDALSIELLFRILGTVDMIVIAAALPWFFQLIAARGGSAAASSPISYRRYLPSAVGISLVAAAFTDVDRFLIALVLPVELIALFHIGARVTRSTNRFLAVPTVAIQPEIARLHAERRLEDIESATRIFLKINVLVAVLAGFTIAIFARDIVVLVASARYGSAAPLIALLSACIPLTSATAPLTTAMKATDRVRGAFRADLAWAGAYVVLAVVLGATLGLIGIGLANLFACLLQLAVAIRLSDLQGGGRMVVVLFRKIVVALAIAQLPLVAASLFLREPGALFLGLRVVLFAGGCLAYAFMLKALHVLDDRERKAIATALRARGLGRWLKFV